MAIFVVIDPNLKVKGYLKQSPKGTDYKSLDELKSYRISEYSGEKRLFDKNTGKSYKSAVIVQQADGSFSPAIVSPMRLTGKYVKDNETVAYQVELGTHKKKLSIKDIISLGECLERTENFFISKSKETAFLKTRQGHTKLDDLPTLEDRQGEVTLPQLFSSLSAHNTRIVRLSHKAYAPIGDTVTETGDRFVSRGIEIAYPSLKYSATKSNVNIEFKKMGVYKDEELLGKHMTLPCYVHRTKAVLTKDKFNLASDDNKCFYVAVPVDKVSAFVEDKYIKQLDLKEETDKMVLTKVYPELDGDYILFIVDTENLNVNSKSENGSLSHDDLCRLVIDRETVVSGRRHLKKIIKKYKEEIKENGTGFPTVAPVYAELNDVLISRLAENGLDVRTGIYTEVKNSYSSKSSSASTNSSITYKYKDKSLYEIDRSRVEAIQEKMKEVIKSEQLFKGTLPYIERGGLGYYILSKHYAGNSTIKEQQLTERFATIIQLANGCESSNLLMTIHSVIALAELVCLFADHNKLSKECIVEFLQDIVIALNIVEADYTRDLWYENRNAFNDLENHFKDWAVKVNAKSTTYTKGDLTANLK